GRGGRGTPELPATNPQTHPISGDRRCSAVQCRPRLPRRQHSYPRLPAREPIALAKDIAARALCYPEHTEATEKENPVSHERVGAPPGGGKQGAAPSSAHPRPPCKATDTIH